MKWILWAGALTPLALLVWLGFTDGLSANPIEQITHWTGTTALVLLMVTLAVTPLRRLTGSNRLVKLRRPLGLFAFFYATLHFLTWLAIDQFFYWEDIVADVLKRPYITVGLLAWLLMIPLAATSTRAMIRRLGKRWQTLHRLVYVSGVLGVLHFYWKAAAKSDVRQPLIFAGVLALLLALRIPLWVQRARRRRVSP
ncbi:MAG: protein-methionine-sulfoxide reductase heme-binding subunit MsrQ [Gemmatimonadota bacterium]